MTILDVDLTIPTLENYQKSRQYIFQIDKSLFKLTGYQVKIFLSISEIVKLKVKLVNYFLVCNKFSLRYGRQICSHAPLTRKISFVLIENRA
jgi:hypothetical protein